MLGRSKTAVVPQAAHRSCPACGCQLDNHGWRHCPRCHQELPGCTGCGSCKCGR